MLRPQGGWLCSLGLLGAQGRGAVAHGSLPPPRGQLRLAGCSPALGGAEALCLGSRPGCPAHLQCQSLGQGHGGPHLLGAAGQGPDLLSWPWNFTRALSESRQQGKVQPATHKNNTTASLSPPGSWFLLLPSSPARSPRSLPASIHLRPAHSPQSSLRPHHPEGSLCPRPPVPPRATPKGVSCLLPPLTLPISVFSDPRSALHPSALHSHSGILAANCSPSSQALLSPRLRVDGRWEWEGPVHGG